MPNARRVLVIGPSWTGALPNSYARAFERLGMEVTCFDDEQTLFRASRFGSHRLYRRVFRRSLWGRLNRQTLELARSIKPSLIFAARASYLEAETVARLRRELGIPVVNYYPDHPYCGTPLDPRKPSTLRRDLIDVMKEYSTVWIWERGLRDRLRADGVTAEYLPFGIDPKIFQPQGDGSPAVCNECGRSHRIAFVGSWIRLRSEHMNAIRRHTVSIWGDGWPAAWRRKDAHHFVHSPTYGESASHIHAHSDISLNVVGDLNVPGHNMRTFEVPASGGVMLSRYTREQDEFFPENVAAAYYRSPAELDAKIESLLNEPEARARIRRVAVRMSAGHTYDQRAAVLLRAHGLSHDAPTSPAASPQFDDRRPRG